MWFVTVQVKHTAGLMRTPSLNATIFGLSKVAWCESYSWYGESYVVRDAIWEGNPGLSRGPRAGPAPWNMPKLKEPPLSCCRWVQNVSSVSLPFPSWSNHLDRRHQFNPQALLLPMSFKTLVYLTQTAFQVYQFEAKYRKGMHESTDTCTFIFCCHFKKLKTHFRPFFCVLVYK